MPYNEFNVFDFEGDNTFCWYMGKFTAFAVKKKLLVHNSQTILHFLLCNN